MARLFYTHFLDQSDVYVGVNTVEGNTKLTWCIYESDLFMVFPPFLSWVKYSLKWFCKINFSISVRLLSDPRESPSKTPRIPSNDQDETARRYSALTHPKSMKASSKWVIGGIVILRKSLISLYWLGSCFLCVISLLVPVEDSFDRGKVWEADLGTPGLSRSDPARSSFDCERIWETGSTDISWSSSTTIGSDLGFCQNLILNGETLQKKNWSHTASCLDSTLLSRFFSLMRVIIDGFWDAADPPRLICFKCRARRYVCSRKTKRVAKYSRFLLSSVANISGFCSLSCQRVRTNSVSWHMT